MIQDYVLAVVSWLFVAALLPSWRKPPPRTTCVTTAILLGVVAGTYGSLAYWNATASAAVLAAVWVALAVKSWLTTRQPRPPMSQMDADKGNGSHLCKSASSADSSANGETK